MRVSVVTGPTEDLIALADARAHLRLDASGSPAAHPDDAYVEDLVATITAELDGPDGWLGRALAPQTLKLTLDAFPGGSGGQGRIWLPCPPLIAVDSIAYVDEDGDTQTLAASKYTVVKTGNDVARIVPAYQQTWPNTRSVPEAVSVTYQAGFSDGSSPPAAAVPADILHWMKVRLTDLYEQRGSVVIGTSVTGATFADSLLAKWRVRGFI